MISCILLYLLLIAKWPRIVSACDMSANEMATMHCLPGHVSPHLSSNGHTIITAESDLPAALSAQQLEDKESGALSEPEELRRSSKRTRMRRSLIFQEKTEQAAADLQSDGKESATSSVTSDDRKKQRSLWTIPETQAFFDALAEHGKDFLAIQSFIQNKLSPDSSKKNKSSTSTSRSAPVPVSSTSTSSSALLTFGHVHGGGTVSGNEVKSREQVRHFYYRTWHKISGSCQFSEVLKSQVTSVPADAVTEDSPEKIQETLKEIDKGVLELYGLINYGEIWKKFPSKWDSRIKSHLKELVLEGSTVIKSGPKAKAIKIKTPVCKALKKLNGLILDGDLAQGANPLIHQLPDDIMVQLLPEDNDSFMRVQAMAQNPRMQCRICLQKKISSLAMFLEHYKWGSDRPRKSLCREFSDFAIEDFLPELRGSVKLSLHRSQLRSLDSLSAGLAISHSATNHSSDPNASSSISLTHPCSSLGLSFRSYLRNTEGRKGSKAGPRAKKEKSSMLQTTSSAQTAAATREVEDSPHVKPATESIAIEIEDSCSSTSSVTPFRDTVKRLALLNQALGAELDDTGGSACESQELVHDSHSMRKASADSQELEIVSSSLRDESEVSLPPPTATLAQWLSSREDRHSDVADDIDLTHDDSIHEADKVRQSPSTTVEDKIVLDIETIREGWTSEETSITFAELYLLLKSPAKIILNYVFLDPDVRSSDERTNFEERHFKNITDEALPPMKSISLLDKLLTAASISLSLHKKMHVSNTSACFPFGTTAASNSSTSASSQQSPASTSRTSVASTSRSPTNFNKKQTQQQMQHTPAQLSGQNVTLVSESIPILSQHNFLMPTGPAPKAASYISSGSTNSCQGSNSVTADCSAGIPNNGSNTRNNNGNKRPRIICEDPQVLEDAIKQLNQNRFMPKKKRQRVIRPITVGPVSSKLLLPRPTLQMIPGAATPASHIQILSAPAAVTVPVTDAGSAAAAGGLSLPICFTPNAVSVPTILIPTVIAANLNASAAASVESDSSPPVALTPAAAASSSAAAADSVHVSVGQPEPLSRDQGRGEDLNQKAAVTETLCESAAADLNLSQNSNSSLPCLSSLLELSLPDPTTPVTSTSSSINHSFFNDNSCSSISEFISFGNPNMGQAALPAGQASNSGLHVSGKEVSKSGQTPNWLLNEGSNSSSLGLSSLIFNTNELI